MPKRAYIVRTLTSNYFFIYYIYHGKCFDTALFGTSKHACVLQQNVQFVARPCHAVSGVAPMKVLQLQNSKDRRVRGTMRGEEWTGG